MTTFIVATVLGIAAYCATGFIETHLREYRRRKQKDELLGHNPTLASSIYEIDLMSGRKFEEFLLLLFTQAGYYINFTSRTQDYGADLILYKDGLRIIIQAKRSKNPVGVKAVQEAASAVKHYRANKAMVITNNRFTRNAHNLARSNEVDLWDRNKLIEFMQYSQNT